MYQVLICVLIDDEKSVKAINNDLAYSGDENSSHTLILFLRFLRFIGNCDSPFIKGKHFIITPCKDRRLSAIDFSLI